MATRKANRAAPAEPMHNVPCDGEAHSNPYIDNCAVCMPRWGVVSIPARFASLAAYAKDCSLTRSRNALMESIAQGDTAMAYADTRWLVRVARGCA